MLLKHINGDSVRITDIPAGIRKGVRIIKSLLVYVYVYVYVYVCVYVYVYVYVCVYIGWICVNMYKYIIFLKVAPEKKYEKLKN